jgi:hypothetical protein
MRINEDKNEDEDITNLNLKDLSEIRNCRERW